MVPAATEMGGLTLQASLRPRDRLKPACMAEGACSRFGSASKSPWRALDAAGLAWLWLVQTGSAGKPSCQAMPCTIASGRALQATGSSDRRTKSARQAWCADGR
jgi:hypothetical protein